MKKIIIYILCFILVFNFSVYTVSAASDHKRSVLCSDANDTDDDDSGHGGAGGGHGSSSPNKDNTLKEIGNFFSNGLKAIGALAIGDYSGAVSYGIKVVEGADEEPTDYLEMLYKYVVSQDNSIDYDKLQQIFDESVNYMKDNRKISVVPFFYNHTQVPARYYQGRKYDIKSFNEGIVRALDLLDNPANYFVRMDTYSDVYVYDFSDVAFVVPNTAFVPISQEFDRGTFVEYGSLDRFAYGTGVINFKFYDKNFKQISVKYAQLNFQFKPTESSYCRQEYTRNAMDIPERRKYSDYFNRDMCFLVCTGEDRNVNKVYMLQDSNAYNELALGENLFIPYDFSSLENPDFDYSALVDAIKQGFTGFDNPYDALNNLDTTIEDYFDNMQQIVNDVKDLLMDKDGVSWLKKIVDILNDTYKYLKEIKGSIDVLKWTELTEGMSDAFELIKKGLLGELGDLNDAKKAFDTVKDAFGDSDVLEALGYQGDKSWMSKFPFSVAFSIGLIMDALDTEPIPPNWHFETDNLLTNGENVSIDINIEEIPESDSFIEIFRILVVILWCIGLAFLGIKLYNAFKDF